MPEIPTQPQPTLTQKSINWKRVLIITAVAVVVIGLGEVVYQILQPKSNEPTQIITKNATSSATVTTPSAKKDETADWKTYTSKTVSFKYPSDWIISNYPFVREEGFLIVASEPGENCPCDRFSVTSPANPQQMNETYDFVSSVVVGEKTERTGMWTGKPTAEAFYEFYTRIPDEKIDEVRFLGYYSVNNYRDTPQEFILLGERTGKFYQLSATNQELLKEFASTFKFLD